MKGKGVTQLHGVKPSFSYKNYVSVSKFVGFP